MEIKQIDNFLMINLAEGGLLNEIGNYLLIPGQFLWGGKSVKVLNSWQIDQKNIPFILERNWKNPIVWVQTALAIALYIPCTILAVGAKWIAYNRDPNLKGMYRRAEESIEEYCLWGPYRYSDILTDQKKFNSSTADKPLLKALLSFHLSEEQIKNWGLEEEIPHLIQNLSEKDLCKAVDYFLDVEIIKRLFERVPREKIFSLIQDRVWKEVLLCAIPDNGEIMVDFVSHLKEDDRLNYFNYGKPSLLGIYVGINIPYSYALHLLPYMIQSITMDNIKKGISSYGPVLFRLSERLTHRINPDIRIPESLIRVLHPWQLPFLIYPLRARIILDCAYHLKGRSDVQKTDIDVLSVALSACSFKTFVEWIKKKDEAQDPDLPIEDRLLQFNGRGWLENQMRDRVLEEKMDVESSTLYDESVRINAFFAFIEVLFKHDLAKGSRLINRYLKAADRELVLEALCTEKSKLRPIHPTLLDIYFRGIYESKISRTEFPQELVDELEFLDLLEGEK